MNHSKEIAQQNWDATNGSLRLPEQLDIHILPKLIKQDKWLELPVTTVDFSQVKKADSAILSVLLHWAKTQQAPIKVIALPQALISLIELYDLQDVLHLETPSI